MQYSDKKQRTRVSKILRRVVAMVCVIALTFAELIYAVTAETDNRKLLNGSFEEGQTWHPAILNPIKARFLRGIRLLLRVKSSYSEVIQERM